MNAPRGFTLVELLIYVGLFAFASYIMITASGVLQRWSCWVVAEQQKRLQHDLMLTVIMRDMTAASPNPDHWSERNGVFKKQFLDGSNVPVAYDVAYTCSGGQCLRWQGVFDYQRQRWVQRQGMVFARVPLKAIALQPQYADVDGQLTVQRAAVLLHGAAATPELVTYRIRSGRVAYAR
jgi:hypothetical protein